MFSLTGIRKILVIQLRAIGDVVLTTSVLPLLRKKFPDARIHFLTGKGLGGILTSLSEVDEVIEYSYSKRHIPGFLRFLWRIRQQNYDLVIDYQGTPGTAIFTWFSGALYRLGWTNHPRRFAYNLSSPANEVDEYVPLQKCRMLEAIGIEEVNTRIRIVYDDQALQTARQFLRPFERENTLRINISVKGKRQARHWFPNQFARLNDLLVEELGARVFFNQAPGEEDYVANVAGLCKYPPILLPIWPLPVFAAFLSLIDLHISYDNGVKHMAIALGTPTISFYGSANPVHWHPPQQPNHLYFLPDVPCKLCGLRECGLMICMESLRPEKVAEIIPQIPALQSKLKQRVV